jgi:hypothetical protein
MTHEMATSRCESISHNDGWVKNWAGPGNFITIGKRIGSAASRDYRASRKMSQSVVNAMFSSPSFCACPDRLAVLREKKHKAAWSHLVVVSQALAA